MKLSRLAIERPITAAMMIVSILVVGGIALARLPLAYLPELDVPFIGINVPYPNSNPLQVEREVVKPVEEVLSTLSGIKTLNASASADEAQFFLEFDWGQELDIVRMQVSEKMDQVKAELPAAIGEIVIFSFNTNDIPVVQGRISAQGVDLSGNYELIEARILNRIRRVPGVARVDLNGTEPPEINIDLILSKVKEHNVDVGALIQNLQGAAGNMVLGQVREDGQRFTARSLGAFTSLDEIGELPINAEGVRLSQIAELTYEEPPIRYGRHLDRDYAVAVEVYKESTANTVDVVRQVMSVIENDINQDPLLQGVKLWVWEDQGEEITAGLNGLLRAGSIGALLAIFSLYFFLRRLDATVIVSLSIPFSIIAACGILYFNGSSLNILSMMGLMLAVGMLVDNAVVVLESIDRNRRREPDRKKAAQIGADQVGTAVAASTLTSLIVFLPLVVGGKTDLVTWLKEVGITISIALACSLFSSLTLIPLVSAHFLGKKQPKKVRSIEWLEARYTRALAWTIDKPVKTLFVLILALGIGLAPFFAGWVEAAIFSGIVNDRIFVQYEFADFTYKSEAERKVDIVEEFLEGQKERFYIDSIYSWYAENEAVTVLNLSRTDLNDDEFKELRTEIREALPEIAGTRLIFNDDSETGGDSTYFAVKLFGQDSGILESLGAETARRLETLDGIQDIRSSTRDQQREIRVKVDREKAERLGLAAQDIADVFSFTLGGMRLPRFRTGEREVETWLALRLEDRENLDDLKALQVGGGSDGRPVLLGDIASFDIVPRPREIDRENRKVRIAVRATYEGEDWESTQEAITELMDAFEMPPGYSWSWNDRILEQQSQNSQMGVNFLLAILLVYIVMASLFESLSQPFAILFSIPFALPGVAWTLAATGTSFNLMSQIGMLILMGIVVNNGIVLLDYMNRLRAQGLSKRDAVLQAGRERLRPILMTALTTIIGLIPLAIRGTNVSGLFYYPMARTVIGGLASSAFFTLLVLPYISLGMEAVGAWFTRLWRESGPRKALAQAPVPDGQPTTAP